MFRRLAPIAALALTAGLALSGCQTNSSSLAVQIGDFSLTNQRVDQIVDEIDDELAKSQQAQASQAPTDPSAPPAPAGPADGLGSEQFGDVRAAVVQLSVFDEVARRLVAEKKLTQPEQTQDDYQQAADSIGISVNNPYVKLAVDSDAYRQLLLSKATAVTPTEQDLHDAYDKVAQSIQVGSYDEVKPQLLTVPELPEGLGLRTELQKAMDRYGVVINPRYLPMKEVPLTVVSSGDGSGSIVLVSLPVGASASPPVRDLAPTGPTAG